MSAAVDNGCLIASSMGTESILTGVQTGQNCCQHFYRLHDWNLMKHWAMTVISQTCYSSITLWKSTFSSENREWLSGWQIIWRGLWELQNAEPAWQKRHQLTTRCYHREKLIYGRNADKSYYFLMGFGSLLLTQCFEMYSTAYFINEIKHSDFFISRNHSLLFFKEKKQLHEKLRLCLDIS